MIRAAILRCQAEVPVPTRTWENLSADRRDRVLNAALAEFGRAGYSGGSLNVIAREAGVAKGSLFQYFTDKFDFYAYVAERAGLRVYGDLKHLLPRPPGRSLFEHMHLALCGWVDYFASHPLERGITIATNLELDPAARAAVRGPIHRIYVEALGPMLMDARERGELRAEADIDVLIAMIIMLLQHLSMAPFQPGIDPILDLYGTEPAQLREPIRRLLHNLLTGFAAVALD
jgi:AcrR family transcriptional regulator